MSEQQPSPPRKDWRYASLRGANLRGVNLTGVNFEHADLRACDLRDANCTGAIFSYADMRGSRLQGANFQNASLTGTQMQGVEAQQVDFSGSDMRGCNLGGACLDGARMPMAEGLASPGEIGDGLAPPQTGLARREMERRENADRGGNADANRDGQAKGRSLPDQQQDRGRSQGR